MGQIVVRYGPDCSTVFDRMKMLSEDLQANSTQPNSTRLDPTRLEISPINQSVFGSYHSINFTYFLSIHYIAFHLFSVHPASKRLWVKAELSWLTVGTPPLITSKCLSSSSVWRMQSPWCGLTFRRGIWTSLESSRQCFHGGLSAETQRLASPSAQPSKRAYRCPREKDEQFWERMHCNSTYGMVLLARRVPNMWDSSMRSKRLRNKI